MCNGEYNTNTRVKSGKAILYRMGKKTTTFKFIDDGEKIEVSPYHQINEENAIDNARRQLQSLEPNMYYDVTLESKTPDEEEWILKSLENWFFSEQPDDEVMREKVID